ncbi:MAG: serine hydrolase domain-containing protein [Ktedonobacteraceae bacterium]
MTKQCQRCHRDIDVKAKKCPHCQADQRSWPGKHKILVSAAVLLVIFGVFGTIVSQLYIPQLVLTDVTCSNSSSHDLNQKLQCLISGYVGKDQSVKSIELAVTKGDGSYSWAGAAGIAYQNSHIPMTKETPLYIASVTKIYIATTIMKLSEEKAFSLDDPMAAYLPADLIKGIDVYHGKDYTNEVTIRELVSMTSGIADYYEEKGTDGKSMFDLFVQNPEKAWTVDEMIQRARDDLKPHFPPGTAVFYSDTNYQLLGKIIEKVTHTQLSSVLEDVFFRPLGLQHTWLVGYPQSRVNSSMNPADVFYHEQNITKSRASRDYWADGGIVSTADDMILFLKALNEGKIITRQSLETMQTWRDRSDLFPGAQYGYGLWHFHLPWYMSALTRFTPTWGVSGSTGSFLYYSVDRNVYIAGSIDSASTDETPFFLMGGVLSQFSTTEH